MAVSTGAHPGYRRDPTKSLDFALADLALTRGHAVANEIAFATHVLDWERTDSGLAEYVIDKLRHLATTEKGDVRISACTILWIYTVDRVDAAMKRRASDSLAAADCRCIARPDGNEDCR